MGPLRSTKALGPPGMERGVSVAHSENYYYSAYTHQKISAPATPGEQTSPVHGAARVQAATCQSQLARPRKAGKSQCATATALDVSSSVARAPTIGAHFPRVRFKGPNCCCNKKNRTLNRKLDLRARARAGHFPGFF